MGRGLVRKMIDFSRHDNHNIELKSAIPGLGKRLRSHLNLYLFMPKSMQLSSYPKSSLIHDFSSRVRLSIPDGGLSTPHPHQRLEEELFRLESLLKQHAEGGESLGRAILEGDIFNHVRHLGAILNEKLKNATSSHSREIFIAHSLLSSPETCASEVERISERVEEISALVLRLQETIEIEREKVRLTILDLLDQFVYDLVVEYLASVNKQLVFVSTLSARFECPRYSVAIRSLRERVAAVARKVARRRSLADFPDAADNEHEIQLYRSSQLKKFFQSEMFIDVSKHESTRRLSEPAAVLGATTSALCALFVEDMVKHGRFSIGLGGASVAIAGIFLYVFKDRLKDRGKSYFFKKMGGFVSDFSQDLYLRKRRIAHVREHFVVKGKQSLPASVRTLRDKHVMTEAERHVGEEVFSFSRRMELDSEGLSDGAPGAIVREVWRLNLARYLKHMDDVYKEMPILTEEGELKMVRSHRVYYFYAILTHAASIIEKGGGYLRSSQSQSAPSEDEVAIYRIALDKKGIRKIEALTEAETLESGAEASAARTPPADYTVICKNISNNTI